MTWGWEISVCPLRADQRRWQFRGRRSLHLWPANPPARPPGVGVGPGLPEGARDASWKIQESVARLAIE